jgi:hypothetical protein
LGSTVAGAAAGTRGRRTTAGGDLRTACDVAPDVAVALGITAGATPFGATSRSRAPEPESRGEGLVVIAAVGVAGAGTTPAVVFAACAGQTSQVPIAPKHPTANVATMRQAGRAVRVAAASRDSTGGPVTV